MRVGKDLLNLNYTRIRVSNQQIVLCSAVQHFTLTKKVFFGKMGSRQGKVRKRGKLGVMLGLIPPKCWGYLRCPLDVEGGQY